MAFRILFILCLSVLPTPLHAADGADATPRMNHIRSLMIERQEQKALMATEVTKNPVVSPENGSQGGLRMIQGLFLCLGIFFIGVFIYRKKSGHAPTRRAGRLKILDRMIVAPKTSLILAEVDGREVLLAVGGEQVSFFPGSAPVENSNNMGLVCRETENLSLAMHS